MLRGGRRCTAAATDRQFAVSEVQPIGTGSDRALPVALGAPDLYQDSVSKHVPFRIGTLGCCERYILLQQESMRAPGSRIGRMSHLLYASLSTPRAYLKSTRNITRKMQ